MGELEGCWATPSTVSPQAPRLPALPLLQATGTQAAWGLGAQSSPISAVLLQDAAAEHWSQPVPRNGACWLLGSEWAGSGGCWGLGGPGEMVLLVLHPVLLAPSRNWVLRALEFCLCCQWACGRGVWSLRTGRVS